VLVTRVVGLVGQAAADVIHRDNAVVVAQSVDQRQKEGPSGRVAVDHDHRLAASLVDVVIADARQVEDAIFVGKDAHHSTPSIRQFNPLPMPRKPTRSPGRRNPRSSARAAVNGSDTVPMLPRYSKVLKSFSGGTPIALSTASRWPAPTWWQITLSRWSPRQPNLVRKFCHVRRPSSTPY